MGNSVTPDLFIGIGDNPEADIKGANLAGQHWRSVLVKTGIHESNENDRDNPADLFCNDAEEAMQILYESSSDSSAGAVDLFMSNDDLMSVISKEDGLRESKR